MRIHQGSTAAVPWFFQAYDSVTGEPGTIDLIEIVPTGTVGEVHLSVIGDGFAHLHGAAELKEIDLVTGADVPTTIDQIDITGDLGQLGPTLADAAGTLSVGGDVVDAIYINEIEELTITGDLAADLTAQTLLWLTVEGTVTGASTITAQTIAGLTFGGPGAVPAARPAAV